MNCFFRQALCVTVFLVLSSLFFQSVSAETATTTITVTPPEACADGIDNDADSFIDYPSDIGCTSGGDTDETDPPPPPPPSTSGGGTVSVLFPLFRPNASFSGLAFPNARISILRDGFFFVEGRADADGKFIVSAPDISVGSYVFTIVAETDSARSSITFFNAVVRASSVLFDAIFLPPAVSLVRAGGERALSGYTVPGAAVSLFTPEEDTAIGETFADTRGVFSFLIPGDVELPVAVAARAFEAASPLSLFLQESVPSPYIRGDLNSDGSVDLMDLSILVYWYGNSAPPREIDLSGDGMITVADVSILLFYWTD